MNRTVDIRDEVDALRERVRALESFHAADDAPGDRDRYDREVVAKLVEAEGPVSVVTIARWYRRAGVRDERKARGRIKALSEDGLIENVRFSDWRYVGPQLEEA